MKKFIITENERQRIYKLYQSKGILKEQDTTTGNNTQTSKYYESPYFKPLGKFIVEMSGNKLFDITDGKSKKDINGNHEEFTVDLLSGSITNESFLSNISLIKGLGGFGALSQDDRPVNVNGNFQTVMINYPNSKASSSNIVGGPSLCTIRVYIQRVDLFQGGRTSYRKASDSPTINLRQYYVPKNKNEWESIKRILWDEKGTYTDTKFKDLNDFYGIYLSPWWPDNNLGEVTFKPNTGTTEEFIPRSIKIDVSDPFEFNSTTPKETAIIAIKKFIEQINDLKIKKPELYNKYIKFIKSQGNVTVYAYASIDDNPNQTIKYTEGEGGNAVTGCGGNKLRSEYNLCLSQKRADEIAGRLNNGLPDLKIFVGKGMGETEEFAKGKKWPDSSKDETLPNRRFVVVLPEYTDMVKK